RAETHSIPIVFVQVIDPVSRGFVNSLARPGGNITGFTNFEFPMGGKWVEVLKEIAPQVKATAVVFNPDTAPYGGQFVQQIRSRARARRCPLCPQKRTSSRGRAAQPRCLGWGGPGHACVLLCRATGLCVLKPCGVRRALNDQLSTA